MINVSRREIKYILTPIQKCLIQNRLDKALHLDENSGPDGYVVRSLYFDTIDDRDFEDKLDGLLNRQKIRIRIYDTNAKYAKLELKKKLNNYQVKQSLLIKKQDVYSLINCDYSVLENYDGDFAREMYLFMKKWHYMPKCIVEYNRTAYTALFNNTRVTLDSNLRAIESTYDIFSENLLMYPVGGIGKTTLEVKYNGFLYTYIKEILSDYNLTQVSSSKYCKSRTITKQGRE